MLSGNPSTSARHTQPLLMSRHTLLPTLGNGLSPRSPWECVHACRPTITQEPDTHQRREVRKNKRVNVHITPACILQLENVAFSPDCKNKTYPLWEHIKSQASRMKEKKFIRENQCYTCSYYLSVLLFCIYIFMMLLIHLCVFLAGIWLLKSLLLNLRRKTYHTLLMSDTNSWMRKTRWVGEFFYWNCKAFIHVRVWLTKDSLHSLRNIIFRNWDVCFLYDT